MIPHLARRFHVVTYDARGHGLSSKPTSGYGFETTVADALAVIRATRLRRPVVVGHSWGAMVALELATRHPRTVAGAVLVDGGLASLPWDWARTKRELAPPPLSGMPLDEFLASIPLWSPVPVTPELERSFLSLMRVHRDGTIRPRLSRSNHMRILHAIWKQRPLDLYGRLRVPALVVLARSEGGGELDRWSAAAKRAALAEARRRTSGSLVKFQWMAGVHDLPVQHPGALARKVTLFAEEVVG